MTLEQEHGDRAVQPPAWALVEIELEIEGGVEERGDAERDQEDELLDALVQLRHVAPALGFAAPC